MTKGEMSRRDRELVVSGPHCAENGDGAPVVIMLNGHTDVASALQGLFGGGDSNGATEDDDEDD